ncbi:MAG TPA: glycoside hydrolase family 3 N-terminal domain-containing protein [Holophagaceae bacterium]|jgi:beta-N-acetylhexosaminidase|nr:glycoside hydrolase family 3 N-terminal domain-containing protein [Holophagaceae bacterium]
MRASDGLLWMGFDGMDAPGVPADLHPGGVILFARNLDPDPGAGPARCKALLDALHGRFSGERTLAVAIDQEGGAVSRLRPWVGATPSLRRIWTARGTAGCETWGRIWGEGLALLGFNVDFAPVSDLWDGNKDAGIGDRAASDDPAEVAAAAGAFLHGLESMGVRGCLKHFPGLGGTMVDSHLGLPELTNRRAVDRNARPFVALSNEDRLVMVAHLKTPLSDLPASLHRGSVAENPWGVRGRFLPDDLEMGGCAAWDWDARVRLSLEAGHEWLLVCQSGAGVRACAEATAKLPSGAVDEALEKNRAMRANLRLHETGPLDQRAWDGWVERLKTASAALA